MTNANYDQLAVLYDKYHGKGLEILAFPSNQFGQQEPGTASEIMEFAKEMRAHYPMMEKVDVNGAHASSVFKLLKGKGHDIKWNFVTKFLVKCRAGQHECTVLRYDGAKNPMGLEPEIVKHLA
eukprot:gnl/TRDRNA2_/TRDRNA2_161232_c0_seq1.p1 gnl/TRDRNA2_/TRDRNA2_161232_c0~~gnl/TRDRNA2_/TRDRNA2_161232_c0_seq1.p1  ORF type:complete len:123 (-),score=26.51 gnl/TRDRNA2_/TRDRNA2_161232_c0_seq1:319-687(-)